MSEDKARLQAFYLLDDIIQNKKYANLTLKNSLKEFESRDKAFICALVYGVLDKLINLDYIISQYAKGKVKLPLQEKNRLHTSGVQTVLRFGEKLRVGVRGRRPPWQDPRRSRSSRPAAAASPTG